MYIWGMKRYITILIFTFLCLFTFPNICWAEVNGIFPPEGSTMPSRDISFQWRNTDTGEYTYMLEVGPAAESKDHWYASVGLAAQSGTSYTYSVPKEFGNKIMWWVKYCPKNQNPCEHVLSSLIYSFNISADAVATPPVSQQQPQVKSIEDTAAPKVVKKATPPPSSSTSTPTKPKEDTTDTMAWNVNTSELSKPFSFPFKEYIGVTQWHGNTAFQKPHTGIDFGAIQKEILAIGDGEVIGKGWDSYNGKCLSGGNYLLVKHSNGMHSSYFHLQSTYVDVGKNVKKGDVLGISGNTGSWNCQPLAYHLHFETRLGRSQSTHVNPVDYIATDWSKVLTLNAKSNSGRLSGDNPHPTF